MIKQISVLYLKIVAVLLSIALLGCYQTKESSIKNQNTEKSKQIEEVETMKLMLEINGYEFEATLEDNESVNEFVEILKESPIEVNMSDYAGFEKVGSLGATLTSNDTRITTNEGDIVLYMSNQVVIFYGSNTWEYTKLAHVDDLGNWKEALGAGDVTVRLSIKI